MMMKLGRRPEDEDRSWPKCAIGKFQSISRLNSLHYRRHIHHLAFNTIRVFLERVLGASGALWTVLPPLLGNRLVTSYPVEYPRLVESLIKYPRLVESLIKALLPR